MLYGNIFKYINLYILYYIIKFMLYRGLCYTFKRQIYYSKYRYFNTKIRNEIAMIILMISINLPSWNLVGSGIADIIIEMSIGIETNSVRIFSEIITFGTSIEDLYFEKIILLITTHLAEVNSCVIIFLIYFMYIKNYKKYFNIIMFNVKQ